MVLPAVAGLSAPLQAVLRVAALLLHGLAAGARSQVDQDQRVVQQPVLHLAVHAGVCGEAGRVVHLDMTGEGSTD